MCARARAIDGGFASFGNPNGGRSGVVLRLLTAAVSAIFAGGAAADVVPYTVDSNTLHLWTFDEASGTTLADSGVGIPITMNVLDQATAFPGNGANAVIGQSSFAGFGNAVNFALNATIPTTVNVANAAGTPHRPIALAASALSSTDGDVTFHPLAGSSNASGAFTMEAVIKFDSSFDPASTTFRNGGTRPGGNFAMEIISGEGDGNAARNFQFRFNQIGTGTGSAASGTTRPRIEFANLFGIVGNQSLAVDVPTSGPHAVNNTDFFHVAVSYNGNEATANNLSFYWTNLGSGATLANLVGTAQMNKDLLIQDTAFAIGNEARSTGSGVGEGESFVGLIDNVRISDTARAANQFIFRPASLVYWNVDSDGAWSTGSNWTGGSSPNAAGVTASLGGGGTPISAPRTVTLSEGAVIGTLVFDNADHSFTVTASGGALTLDNNANAGVLLVSSGNHSMSAPVVAGGAGVDVNVLRSQDTITVSGVISSGGPLGKAGPGTMILSSASSISATTVSAGTLVLSGPDGSVGPNDITLGTGAAVVYDKPADLVVANNILGQGGSVQKEGSNQLTLSGANTFGRLVINGGSVVVGTGGAIPTGAALTTEGSATLDLNGFNATLSALFGSGGSVSDSTAGGTSTLSISGTGAGDYSGSINDGPNGRVISVVKTNTGSQVLRNSSSYSGGTLISRGVIDIHSGGALGSGTVTINPLGTDNARLNFTNGITFTNPITIVTSVPGVAQGTLRALDGTITLSGPISIEGNSTNGGHFVGSPTGTGRLQLDGPITAVTALLVRFGDMRFAGGGSYPRLEIRADNTSLGANNGIATNAVVDLAGNGSTTVYTTLDLAGFDQRLAGVSNTITNTLAALITNTSGAPSELTLDLGVGNSVVYGGSIQGNLSVSLSSGTQTLTKTGTTELNGIYNYTGATTVVGGELQFGSSVTGTSSVVLGEAGILTLLPGGSNTLRTGGLSLDITALLQSNNNDLIIDYADVSPISSLISLFANAQIIASGDDGQGLPTYLAIAEAVDLGLTEFAGQTVDESTVVAKFTYVGDANLDGQVDALDYERVDLAIGNAGVFGTAQGDLNYDGSVDALDYEQIDLNIGNGVGTPLAGVFIPEPAGLSLALLSAGLLVRRRK